jgi:membrane protein required for colicin V production
MQASFSSRGGSAGLVAAALKAPASLSPSHAKGNADLPNCNGPIRMNPFDAAVYFCLLAAVVLGFNAGLLRSLATIVGYLAAAPVAVGVTPYLTPILAAQLHLSPAAYWAALTGVFLAAGIVLGALLGAVRIGLVAVLIVLIFDRVIPTGREPAFLAGSRLRPLLSQAGEAGVNSLPPEAVEAIDRLKHARGF